MVLIGAYNEYVQHMFLQNNKKNILPPLLPGAMDKFVVVFFFTLKHTVWSLSGLHTKELPEDMQ